MIEAAASVGRVLAVGHTERFNPAVAAARPLLTDPRFIEVHRLGTFPERSLDIDVVFDLMIHDLDVVLSLVESDVESIEAVGVPVLTGRVDIANARLRFANGCIANLTASRISRDRVRKIRLLPAAAYVSIDYAAQKVERLAAGAQRTAPMPVDRGRQRSTVANEEPLKRELADFVDAVRDEARAVASPASRRPARSLASIGDSGITDHECTNDTEKTQDSSVSPCLRGSLDMYSDLNDFLADLDKRQAARAHPRDGQPRSRDRRGHRSRLQDRRRRPGAAVRDSPPASTCRSPPTCSDRSSACASRSA